MTSPVGDDEGALASEPFLGVAVVLAGGESLRFGSDKLSAGVGGVPLLDRAMEGLPDGFAVIVVGPERRTRRQARFVREEPPGGGPAAGMVTGLRAGLQTGVEQFVVLPGDAPHAGQAAALLLKTLLADPAAIAVVATDAAGFEQPLQLALFSRAAKALVAAAGPSGAHNQSARALVNRLDPPARRLPVPVEAQFDIDTQAQLDSWNHR